MQIILEFGDYIWYYHEKCIKVSTDMAGIGSGIREVAAFDISRILR